MSAKHRQHEVPLLDEATLQDLEVFHAANNQPTLFDYCNQTRFEGGARVLRRRMANPASNPEAIKATQDSIRFIMQNRPLFQGMPSAYGVNRVDHYLREVLPMVVKEQWLEFHMESVFLWLNHDRHYSAISLGVQVTCRFFGSLERFASASEFIDAPGELGQLLGEIKQILAKPKIREVPTTQENGWPWQVVRLDQIFRLHEKSTVARLQALLHEIDALVSLADVSEINHLVLPVIEQGPLMVDAEELTHPFVERAVPNPVRLDQTRRLLFLSGPNMAGKTTYLRSFATALYFAHIGMGVAAKSFRFVPAERLFSSITLTDDLRGGISYFRAEALRVKMIAEAVANKQKVVALMDEPFKGTNVKDALDASRVMVEKFAARDDCLFMLSSHLIELEELLGEIDEVDCRYFEAEESGGKLRFDYRLRPGISNQRLGMRVLEEEGVLALLGSE